MVNTKLFLSNKSQAVRLPKAVAFPDSVSEVSITAIGQSRVISPKDETWDLWFNSEGATDDFMQDRQQPPVQERETLDD